MAAFENGRIVRVRRWLFMAIGAALTWMAFCSGELDFETGPEPVCECEAQ